MGTSQPQEFHTMARTLSNRRRRTHPVANTLPTEFTPEVGHPIVCLWILRLLNRGGAKMLRKISDHTALMQHLGIAVAVSADNGSGDWDDEDADNEPSTPDLTPALIRRLLRQAETDAASHALPEPLASNISALSKELGLDHSAAQVLAFCVLLANNSPLEECFDTVGDLSDNRALSILEHLLDVPVQLLRSAVSHQGTLYQSGLLRIDHNNHFMNSKFDLLNTEFAARMVHAPMLPIDVLRGLIHLAPAGTLRSTDYAHITADLQVLQPYVQHALDHQRSGVNAFIYGAPGTGKTQLMRLLGGEMACSVYEVACEDSDGDPISGERRLRAWQVAQTFLKGQRALLVFDEAEDVFNDGGMFVASTAIQRKGWMNQRLESGPVPTLWLSNSGSPDAAFTRRFDMVFELASPPRAAGRRCGQLAGSTGARSSGQHRATDTRGRRARRPRGAHRGRQLDPSAARACAAAPDRPNPERPRPRHAAPTAQPPPDRALRPSADQHRPRPAAATERAGR
jgi:hypothetical protein